MSVTKKTYTLGKIKQLIDLNGDSVNFDLTFTVTGKDETMFNVLVVDQTTLDNSPELQYKEAKGTISGNIVADKNVYQNYFLILKSETPCQVEVELHKKELPRTPDPLPDPRTNPDRPSVNQAAKTASSWFSLRTGMIVVACLVAVCLLYYMYNNKESSSHESVSFSRDSGRMFNSPYKGNSDDVLPRPPPVQMLPPTDIQPSEVAQQQVQQEKPSEWVRSSSPALSSRSSVESRPQQGLSLLSRLNQLHGKANRH